MAIARVGSRYAAGSSPGGNLAFSPTGACAAGNRLILFVATGNDVTVTGVTDTKSNIWSVDQVEGSRYSAVCSVHLTTGLTTSDTITVTFTGGGATTAAAFLEEFSGVLASGARDQKNLSYISTGTTAPTVSTLATTVQADELVIGGFYVSGVLASPTPASGYTLTGHLSGVASGNTADLLYRVVSATGVQTTGVTYASGPSVIFAHIVTYKAASASTTHYGTVSRATVFGAAVAGNVTAAATLYGATSMFTIFGAVTTGSESSPSLPAPTDLVVVPVSETQINLDWEPSAGATGYRIERATSSGPFVEIDTTAATSYTDTGLDPSNYYAYRVRAEDADDLSAYTSGDGSDAVTDVLPTEGVSIASGAMLAANPAWTRIDTGSVVAEYSIRRGRQDELEKTGTGTASIRLNDRNGEFNPPALDGCQAQLALWNPVTATSHIVFRGFVDTVDYDLHPSGFVTYANVQLVDALDYLAGVEIAPGTAGDPPPGDVEVAAGDIWYIGEQVNHRIKALLSEANWPPELMTIFTGNVWVKEQVAAAGTSILSLLGDAADAEFPGVANLYASKLGKVTFHGRLARFNPEATAASAGTAWKFTRWKAGDGSATADPSYAQLRGLGFTRDRKRVINAALAYPYRAAGVEPELSDAQMAAQVVIDQPSIDAYGLHSWSAESLMTHRHKTDDPDAKNKDLKETKLMARHYVENYKEPQTRLTRLEFRSLRPDDPRAAATWALMCGVEISDTVRVKAAGMFDDTEFYVEGISYDVRAAGPEYHDVTLSLDVSPIAYYANNPFDD